MLFTMNLPDTSLPHSGWGRRRHLDRFIAVVLFLGGVFVSLDLPLGLSSNHQLWKLPFIKCLIYPAGLFLLSFWGMRSLNLGAPGFWNLGWWLSILWHFSLIAWLVAGLIGLVVMLQAMPFLLVWLFVGLAASILALIENKWRISEKNDP
jgi:hypothetical protein